MEETYQRHERTITVKFCKILLEKGVAINACTKEGKSALWIALEQVNLVYLGYKGVKLIDWIPSFPVLFYWLWEKKLSQVGKNAKLFNQLTVISQSWKLFGDKLSQIMFLIKFVMSQMFLDFSLQWLFQLSSTVQKRCRWTRSYWTSLYFINTYNKIIRRGISLFGYVELLFFRKLCSQISNFCQEILWTKLWLWTQTTNLNGIAG